MSRIGDAVRSVLYEQPGQIPQKSDQSSSDNRVRRAHIPNFIYVIWEKLEGISLKSRKAAPHNPTQTYLTKSKESPAVPESVVTKNNAESNKAAIKGYLAFHQQKYLQSLSEWRDLTPRAKTDIDLNETLKKRTKVVAMWLVNHKGDSEISGELSLPKVRGNGDEFSRGRLTPDLLHEATNIAFRSMLDDDRYEFDPGKALYARQQTMSHRLYPDSAVPEHPDYPTEKTEGYDAKYFEFDNADPDSRYMLFNQWSHMLNAPESDLDEY
ncbi:hypothetical protein ACWJJH_04800 [Endozoicomonadaceae bacterium StTr2]